MSASRIWIVIAAIALIAMAGMDSAKVRVSKPVDMGSVFR